MDDVRGLFAYDNEDASLGTQKFSVGFGSCFFNIDMLEYNKSIS